MNDEVPAPRTCRALTPERIDAFLRTVESVGSDRAAAKAATPWAIGRHGGLSSFRDLAKRDPEFAVQWQTARDDFQGKVEAVVSSHILEGRPRPVFQGGRQVGEERVFDTNLTLRWLAAHDPAKWSEKTRTEIEQTVRHLGIHLTLTAQDVLLLEDPDERRTFAQLLHKIGQARKKNTDDERPA